MADFSSANVTKKAVCYLFPKLRLQWKPQLYERHRRLIFSHCGMCRIGPLTTRRTLSCWSMSKEGRRGWWGV